MGIKIAVRQYQQLVEQLHPQVMHQAQGNLGQVVVTQERTQSLPRRDQNDQQGHGHQQLQVLEERHIGEEHGFGVAQAIDEVLENPGQHRLSGGKYHKAQDTQQENAYVGFYIPQQSKIDFQA
ncbi:hypothetical protein D3C81_1941250 [compost metagenome]